MQSLKYNYKYFRLKYKNLKLHSICTQVKLQVQNLCKIHSPYKIQNFKRLSICYSYKITE